MGYSGIIIDGSVSNAKIAVGTISGDRLAANFNYPGDMTVQRLCAAKCLLPAVTACSCLCYGGYFFGRCGLCACGSILGALVSAPLSSVCLGTNDCAVYTCNKIYAGGGLILAGSAGCVEGSVAICAGVMSFYSCGCWKVVTAC